MHQLAYGALAVFLVGLFGPLCLLAIHTPGGGGDGAAVVAFIFCQVCACAMGFVTWRIPLGKACAFMALAVLVLSGASYLLFRYQSEQGRDWLKERTTERMEYKATPEGVQRN
jgi:hypothetical protein